MLLGCTAKGRQGIELMLKGSKRSKGGGPQLWPLPRPKRGLAAQRQGPSPAGRPGLRAAPPQKLLSLSALNKAPANKNAKSACINIHFNV